MAIRNTKLGGTDFTDGEVLYDYDLDDTFNALYQKSFADNTGGIVSNSTTETDIATVTVPINTFDATTIYKITGGFRMRNASNTILGTFRLYVNGVVVKTVTLGNTGISSISSSGCFCHLATGIDNVTSSNIIKITAQMNLASVNVDGYCDGLIVEGMTNNN